MGLPLYQMCGPLSGPCVSLSLQCRKEAGVADFLPRSQSSNENSEFLRVLSPCPIYGADGARDIAISLLSPPPPPVASALRSLIAWLTFCQLFILHQQSLLFLKDPPEASSTPFLARALLCSRNPREEFYFAPEFSVGKLVGIWQPLVILGLRSSAPPSVAFVDISRSHVSNCVGLNDFS